MTFNGISWGYLDSEQTKPYAYTSQRILSMLHKVTANGGNLLLNIGPAPDGSVPADAVEPLTKVGKWLENHGEAVYGKHTRVTDWGRVANAVSSSTASADGKTFYVWNWVWPNDGEMAFGSATAPRRITLMDNGQEVEFEHRGSRILLKNLPKKSPDALNNVAVFTVEFDEAPEYHWAAYYPQLNGGRDFTGGRRL